MSEQQPRTGKMVAPESGVTRQERASHPSRLMEELPALAQADNNALADFSRHVHSYVCEHIQFADQKAGFLFAFAGAVLAYAFQKSLHMRWLKTPASWSIFDLMAFLSMFSLLISELLAASVVLPRLRSSHRGTIFFRSIAAHVSAGEYATEMSSLDADGFSRELLKHAYDLSKICSTKYSVLTSALWVALVGIICGIFAMLA